MEWKILRDEGDVVEFYVEFADKNDLQKMRLDILREFFLRTTTDKLTAIFTFCKKPRPPSENFIPPSRWFAD